MYGALGAFLRSFFVRFFGVAVGRFDICQFYFNHDFNIVLIVSTTRRHASEQCAVEHRSDPHPDVHADVTPPRRGLGWGGVRAEALSLYSAEVALQVT